MMYKSPRKRDPMALFLFLVVAEGLSDLMTQALAKGMYLGVNVGCNNVEISLLRFTNDTLFFAMLNLQNIMCIKYVDVF